MEAMRAKVRGSGPAEGGEEVGGCWYVLQQVCWCFLVLGTRGGTGVTGYTRLPHLLTRHLPVGSYQTSNHKSSK